MPEDWGAVASDVSAVLEEEGFFVTLVKKGTKSGPDYAPVYGPDQLHPLKTLKRRVRIDDPQSPMRGSFHTSFLFAAGPVFPVFGDKIEMADGRVFSVNDVHIVEPAGVPVFYRAMVAS